MNWKSHFSSQFQCHQSDVVHAVQWSQDCTDLYTGEAKQPLHKRKAQCGRASSSGQDSAVHLHLKEDNNVNILARESIHVKLEWPSLNRGGGRQHHLTHIFSPDSLSAIHTWAQLALETHMQADTETQCKHVTSTTL